MDHGDNGSGNGVDAMFSDELRRSVVGVVIGKGGDMINQIQNPTGTAYNLSQRIRCHRNECAVLWAQKTELTRL